MRKHAKRNGGLIELAALVVVVVGLSGCVTGTTIEAAKEHVNYKPQTVENRKIMPPKWSR